MGNRTLLRGGHLVTMDARRGDLDGDILIEDNRILDVGERITDDTAELVELHDAVVIPGLIDTHVHLWQAPVRGMASGCYGREYFGVVHPLSGRLRSSDMYDATYGAALEFLTHGVTTVFDFCHATNSPEHAASSLDALEKSGIRALFGFCFRHRPEAPVEGFETLGQRRAVLEQLQKAWGDHDRIRLAVALNNIDHVSAAVHAQELSAARELGLISTLHTNLAGQVSMSHAAGLLGNDILWVHAGAITDGELELLRDNGGAIACTAEIEAGQMSVTPVVNRAVRHGVPVTLGTDVPAVHNGDMISALRIAHVLSRLYDGQLERAQGRTGARTTWSPTLNSTDILRMATVGSAEVLGLGDEIGSITPGKKADLAVISTEPFGLGAASPVDYVLFQSTSRNIERVYVSGQLVVKQGIPVGVDLREVRANLNATREWVLGRDPRSPWTEINDAARARYEVGQGKA